MIFLRSILRRVYCGIKNQLLHFPVSLDNFLYHFLSDPTVTKFLSPFSSRTFFFDYGSGGISRTPTSDLTIRVIRRRIVYKCWVLVLVSSNYQPILILLLQYFPNTLLSPVLLIPVRIEVRRTYTGLDTPGQVVSVYDGIRQTTKRSIRFDTT